MKSNRPLPGVRRLSSLLLRRSLLGAAVIVAAWCSAAVRATPGFGQEITQEVRQAPVVEGKSAEGKGADEPELYVLPDAETTKIERPVMLLRYLGMETSYYEMLKDGVPVDDTEMEALLKMLYAVRRFDALNVHKFQTRKPDLPAVELDPQDHRGEILSLVGFVQEVQWIKPLPEQTERFQLPGFYRCRLKLGGDSEYEMDVYTPVVPKAWTESGTRRPVQGWRASVDGFFLKVVGQHRFALAAQRMAWHPRGLVGDLGMDVGLFDGLKNQGALTGEEREAFYQMMAAVGRAGTNELIRRTKIEFDAVEVKNNHVRDWIELPQALLYDAAQPHPSGGKRLWERLGSELQEQIRATPASSLPSESTRKECIARMNRMLLDPEFFDARSWLSDYVSPEAVRLLHQGFLRMKPADVTALNRGLVDTAFPDLVRPGVGPVAVDDVLDWPKFLETLRVQARRPTPTPGKRIMQIMSKPLQMKVKAVKEEEPDNALKGAVTAELNRMIRNAGFFHSVAWQEHGLSDETVGLIHQGVGKLTREELRRFNRLLLEAAYPEIIAPTSEYSVVPYFNHPSEQHGKLTALIGTARRAIRIAVDDEDVRTRFNIDHYYQIEVFTEDSQDNPISFCVRSLPPGMPHGENIRELVRIPAFFFKVWSYKATPGLRDAAVGMDPDQVRWPAPLFIGREPIWIRDEDIYQENPLFGIVSGALFLTAIGLVWVGVWSFNRSDDKFHRENIARRRELEPGESLNEMGIEEGAGPDFSFLLQQADALDAAAARAEDPNREPTEDERRLAEVASKVSYVPSRSRYYVKETNAPKGMTGGFFSNWRSNAGGGGAERVSMFDKRASQAERENIFAETVRRSQERPTMLRIAWPLIVMLSIILAAILLSGLVELP